LLLKDAACFCVWNLHITEAGIPNLLAERTWEKCQLWTCNTKGTSQKFIRLQGLCISAHFLCTVAIVPAGLYLCARDTEPSLLTRLLRGLACLSLPREGAPCVVTGVGTADCGLEWRFLFAILTEVCGFTNLQSRPCRCTGPGGEGNFAIPAPPPIYDFFI
jgi:hypothetical protein